MLYSFYLKGEMKTCKTCKISKSLEEFHKQPTSRDGRNTSCKVCQHIRVALDRKNPDKRELFRQYQRRSGMKSRYGITPEIYADLVKKQKNKCLICGNEPIKGGTHQNGILHIDHCHSSGKVRGLLCHLCNRGLGLFREEMIR